ncbi:hypothetical protein GCM10009628_14710 [Paeniglutamicibacter kerguelensis]
MPRKWLVDTGYCSKANLEIARDLKAEPGTGFSISAARMKHGTRSSHRRGAGFLPMPPPVSEWPGS